MDFRMDFQVANKTFFAFETDLPPSSLHIHPSGVIHAHRSNAPTANANLKREEHVFAWIDDCLHAEAALKHLEENGFNRASGIAFIPYSTKRNWIERYPHAAPALECDGNGWVKVHLNYRPYPNGLGEVGAAPLGKVGAAPQMYNNMNNNIHNNVSGAEFHGTGLGIDDFGINENRKNKSWIGNILRERAFLGDAERDELHIEIYNYLSWLHKKMEALQEKSAAVAEDYPDEKVTTVAEKDPEVKAESAAEVVHASAESSIEDGAEQKSRRRNLSSWNPPVDVKELEGALERLEWAFAVIANAKSEAAEKDDQGREQGLPGAGSGRGAPFLEVIAGAALRRLVAERRATGKPKRRSRKRFRGRSGTSIGQRRGRSGGESGRILQSPVRCVEEQGNCITESLAEAISDVGKSKYDMFQHPDGVYRRFPPDWELSKVKLMQLYLLWHCGEESQKISPMKSWDLIDFKALRRFRRSNLTEIRQVTAVIDNAAREKGTQPRGDMTPAEATDCFHAGKYGLCTNFGFRCLRSLQLIKDDRSIAGWFRLRERPLAVPVCPIDTEMSAIIKARQRRSTWPVRRNRIPAFIGTELTKVRMHNSAVFRHENVRIEVCTGRKEDRLTCPLCMRATTRKCSMCEVPLCVKPVPGESLSCFDLWHLEKDLKSTTKRVAGNLSRHREEEKLAKRRRVSAIGRQQAGEGSPDGGQILTCKLLGDKESEECIVCADGSALDDGTPN